MTIEFNGVGGLMEGDFGTADINVNLDSVLNLSGTDEYLINSATAGENFRSSDASGTITAWIKPLATTGGSAPGNAVIFSASDEGSGSYYFKVMVRNDGKLWIRNRDSSTVYDLKGSNIIPDNVWTHVAVASNGSTTKMYINGVVETVVVDAGSNNGDWLGDMTGSKLDNVSIGAELNDGGASNFFKGAITDVRYFNAEINQPEIQIMASRMYTDHPDTVRTDQLKHWWKLNNSTIGAGTDELGDDYGDSGTTDIPLTPTNIVAGDIIYDEFSVNVQDNSTTTDGTFTVTQGKLECKALTCLDFYADNDHIVIADNAELSFGNGSTDTPFTMSAWVRMDDATRFEIMTKGVANTQFEWMFFTNG